MPQLSLGPDIHMTQVDGDIVILDARRDQYLCVTRADAEAIRAVLQGDADMASDLIAQLLDDNIFVVGQSTDVPCLAVERARTDLGRELSTLRMNPAALLCLALACVRTLIDLRAPPAIWFARQRRHAARSSRRRRPTGQLWAEARRFAVMRSLVPRSGRCLVRSLLLIHYLRLRGWTVEWVFGVRTHPFQAHCWVEHDGVVLNDTLEHVRWYTPVARA